MHLKPPQKTTKQQNQTYNNLKNLLFLGRGSLCFQWSVMSSHTIKIKVDHYTQVWIWNLRIRDHLVYFFCDRVLLCLMPELFTMPRSSFLTGWGCHRSILIIDCSICLQAARFQVMITRRSSHLQEWEKMWSQIWFLSRVTATAEEEKLDLHKSANLKQVLPGCYCYLKRINELPTLFL